jgi:hypothetical protein
MSDAKVTLTTLTPYEVKEGLHYTVLGVTAADVVLTGAGGKTESVPLESLKGALAGSRVNVKLHADGKETTDVHYELVGGPVLARPASQGARTNSGRAGNCGADIKSGMGRLHNL